jgi:hypothetical protein
MYRKCRHFKFFLNAAERAKKSGTGTRRTARKESIGDDGSRGKEERPLK